MKLSDINAADRPILSRKVCVSKKVETFEQPSRSMHNWPIGTVIEFPDTIEEIKFMQIPVKSFKTWNPRIQSHDSKGRFSTMGVWETHSVYDFVLLILKDKKPAWLSLTSLRNLWDTNVSKYYKFNQEMCHCISDYDRVHKLLGRTFCIAAKKQYSKPIFKDGVRTNKRKMRMFSILREVHE